MPNIVHTDSMSEVIKQVTEQMLHLIGEDNPKMTQRSRDAKAAQRHMVRLFAEMLSETWILPEDIQVQEIRIG